MDTLQPTVIFEPAATGHGQSYSDVSQANVGILAGSKQKYTDEVAQLLRQRLSAAALIVACVLTVVLVTSLFTSTTNLWGLRLAVLAVVFGALAMLRQPATMTLEHLRFMEWIIFGAVAVQLALMQVSRLHEYAILRDALSLISVYKDMLAAWALLIFVYGTLIPNSWRRGAAIMIPASLVPYAMVAVQGWLQPGIAELMAGNHAMSLAPMPIVSALVATFAAHIIHSARRDAFKARRFGQYRLMEKLGSGGMGEVYRAEHMLLKRPCAIKLIRSASETDAQAIERFEKEVRLTARLTHWNTVEIYDYGRTDDGTFYYVMELLPGMSLEELVQRYGPLPAERVVYLISQICSALHEAHAIGMTHRDIKPANIFASQRGGVHDVAKLLDFGLVKEHNEKAAANQPGGWFSGTPHYMAPEQASSFDEVDARADIYALGAVMFYLATGTTPFQGTNVLELLDAHARAELPKPSSRKPGVTAELDAIIEKCMSKSPEKRFQTVMELKRALERCHVGEPWGYERADRWWRETRVSRSQSIDSPTIEFAPTV